MKKIFVIIAAMFLSSALYAQVHFNVNLGVQPYWGHSGYNSHRVIIYHRPPVRQYVIYRNENPYGYESYPLQKHDNGKHKGWYKGNNGNGYDNRNGNGNDNDRKNDNNYNNDNGYYNNNDNGNGNYNGNDNGNGRGNDNGYYNNDKSNGNYNDNNYEKENDVVPDKYK